MAGPILEMRQITKSFPGVLALDRVDFDLRAGEVHILLGENGAGKSTLMKTLSGAHEPDSGSISVGGQQVQIRTPKQAQALGIRMIHQESAFVPLSPWGRTSIDAIGHDGPMSAEVLSCPTDLGVGRGSAEVLGRLQAGLAR